MVTVSIGVVPSILMILYITLVTGCSSVETLVVGHLMVTHLVTLIDNVAIPMVLPIIISEEMLTHLFKLLVFTHLKSLIYRWYMILVPVSVQCGYTDQQELGGVMVLVDITSLTCGIRHNMS